MIHALRHLDLVLCNFSTLPLRNGMTMRQSLGLVNTLLGGGSGVYSIAQLSPVTAELSVWLAGETASPFVQDDLVAGPCP